MGIFAENVLAQKNGDIQAELNGVNNMIRIYLGKLGSGKTVSAIREIKKDRSGRMNYTNIGNKLSNSIIIKGSDIVTRKLIEVKKSGQEVFKYEFNLNFWNQQKKPLNVVWDEIHLVANSRESQSKLNRAMSRFLSMGRRITGYDDSGYGHFIFIAQASRTIDVNIKDLCNEIRYHIMYWILECKKCHASVWVSSEMKEVEVCLYCGSWKLKRTNFKVQVFKFSDWINYQKWIEGWGKFYFEKLWIMDIENYFGFYNTHQTETIFDEFT